MPVGNNFRRTCLMRKKLATNVIDQEIVRARLDGIVREMQAAVLRTGYSTIIRESHDFSAGITDHEGNVVGQHSPLPTHLGAYPDCVKGVLTYYSLDQMKEGDCFLTNHPYFSGCPHPNDMVVVMPVFADNEVIAFCASMGHKVDIGGQSPGSRNAGARDLFGEGLSILPVKFMDQRVLLPEVVQFLKSNTRTPELVLGDLEAQAGALWSIGIKRLADVVRTYGKDAVLASFKGLGDRTESRARQVISTWLDGSAEAEAFIDDIARPGETIRLHVKAIKKGDQLTLDFSGSGEQSAGPVNARPPFVRGMVHYAAIAMMDSSIPNNYGLGRAIESKFKDGTVICPTFPAPVGFYSMTMPVVEDIIFEALSKISGKPEVAHNSVSGMLVLGATGAEAKRYVQYEIIVSGNGAYNGGDGYTGTGHSWTGGAKYTGVEIIESEFPVEMQQFNLVVDSGGPGKYRGGLALRREYRVKTNAQYSGGTPRTLVPAHGVLGGGNGKAGKVRLNPGTDNERLFEGLVSNVALSAGDVVCMETASAGGSGSPEDRDQAKIVSDLRNGYITAITAEQVYGLSKSDIDAALAIPD